MFKPHYGKCINGCDGIIVVKKGYCGPCNEKYKRGGKNAAANGSAQLPISEAQDIEGYTRTIGYRIPKKSKKKHRGKRTSPAEIRKKVDFGKNAAGLQGITKEHTYVYMKIFGYTIADFVPCEISGDRCVDIHHIFSRGMGGTDLEDELYNRIENLMGLTRKMHDKYGDKQQFYEFLIHQHFEFLSANGIPYDKDFFEKWQR